MQMAAALTIFPFPQSVGVRKYCNTNWRGVAMQLEVYCDTFFEK